MRVGIVGAGAIGTYLAGRLAAAGEDVTLVARPAHVDALLSGGVRLQVREMTLTQDVEVVDRLESAPDVVLLTVKTQDLAAACQDISGVAKDVTVVTLQNGVRADRLAASCLERATIVGAVATCAVTALEPGVARVEVPGWFVVGDPWRRANREVSRVAEVLGHVAPAFVTPDLPGARWTKLLGNLTNGLSAATGLSLAELGRGNMGRRLVVKVLREGHRVLRTAGIRLDHRLYGWRSKDRKTALVAFLQSLVSTLVPVLPESASASLMQIAARTRLGRLDFRGSTWQSLARGRPTEIDYLNGEIVRLGSSVGVPTPYNSRIVEAVHAAERTNHVSSLGELCRSAT